MDESHLCQALRELEFFSGLPDVALHSLAGIASIHRFQAGTVLFSEGSQAQELFVIQSGRIELCMAAPGRGCLPILTLEVGDLVGWSGIAGNSLMTATAVASVETVAIALSAAALRDLCERDHEFGYHILRRVLTAISRRLVATRLQLLDLFSDTSPNIHDRLLEPTL